MKPRGILSTFQLLDFKTSKRYTMEEKSYIGGVVSGLKSLGTGLKTTMREFFTPKSPSNTPKTAKRT